MTVAVYDYPHRVPPMGLASHPATPTLEDRFEVIKDIGDGSFGSVALARVRTAGSHIAKRGTMVSSSERTWRAAANSYPGCHQDHEEDL